MLFYIFISTLIFAVGMVFGHALATTTFIQFVASSWSAWLGMLVGFLISLALYKKSGEELRQEASRLRKETLEVRKSTARVLRYLEFKDVGIPVKVVRKTDETDGGLGFSEKAEETMTASSEIFDEALKILPKPVIDNLSITLLAPKVRVLTIKT